ncbi:MAG: PASTA domain-containing protein, partial [Anaerolineae bacterium]
ASAVLAQTGLLAQVTGQEYSAEVPLGRILRQDPPGGERASRGSIVRLVVSKGSDKTTVPDVVGQSYSSAEAMLVQSNLNAARQDVWSERPSDTVVAQDPPAGTQVIPGTTVLLRVSSGRTLSINATLGDVARLLTAEADRGSLRPGETLHITFRWQALRPVQNRFSVFVHLVNASGQIVTQDDSEPARGSRPTITWTAGEVISDAHMLTVPADAAPGEYRVLVGLYLPEANERVPVVQSGRADSEGNALVAHRVAVGP